MSLYAVINGDVVHSIVIANAPLSTNSLWVCVDDITPLPGPGWKYVDGVFSPPELPPITYTRLELINRFGVDYNNILTASKTDVEVEVWLEKFRLQETFTVNNTEFINNINFLVTKNLITQEKADSILT